MALADQLVLLPQDLQYLHGLLGCPCCLSVPALPWTPANHVALALLVPPGQYYHLLLPVSICAIQHTSKNGLPVVLRLQEAHHCQEYQSHPTG